MGPIFGANTKTILFAIGLAIGASILMADANPKIRSVGTLDTSRGICSSFVQPLCRLLSL